MQNRQKGNNHIVDPLKALGCVYKALCELSGFAAERNTPLSRTPSIVPSERRLKPPRFTQPSVKRAALTQQQVQLLESFSQRSHSPTYASRATLESLVLSRSRLKFWGIEAVIIDYTRIGSSEGSNWRIVGFASGKVDRDAALLAITAAAEGYAMWIMVEDADPSAGGLVRRGSEPQGIG